MVAGSTRVSNQADFLPVPASLEEAKREYQLVGHCPLTLYYLKFICE